MAMPGQLVLATMPCPYTVRVRVKLSVAQLPPFAPESSRLVTVTAAVWEVAADAWPAAAAPASDRPVTAVTAMVPMMRFLTADISCFLCGVVAANCRAAVAGSCAGLTAAGAADRGPPLPRGQGRVHDQDG